MEVSMFTAAGQALLIILDPFRLMLLGGGVLMGLLLGIVPGIGGLVGLSLLLPFTFTMDPYSAFALLLGLSAVVGTGDTIPAILFGVPGGSGAQATVLDGYPMAKRGEAGRALSAAYTSSLIGGLVGALILAVTVPLMRPFILSIGSPELLAISIFGISMVAVLSGTAPLRGLAAAGIGILLSMVGADQQTATLRWTMGSYYLWEGIPLVPLVLGLFAVPELADMAIRRMAISSNGNIDVRGGTLQGARDALKNWWLVVRCGAIGAAVGALPGLGASVVDWLAYGHAKQTVKDAAKTFGTGDVRGVIAPESANNSNQAGALIPTIAFGVPGSASMAILLGAFLMHGLVPGPEMLTVNLNLTYSMVWSLAIANILGAGICFLFSGQLAKIALLRYSLILPAILVVTFVGAFQSTRNWGDLLVLLIFAVLGWTMKQLKWARPPLVLGFVLGAVIERYLFISTARFGYEWLTRPIVLVFLAFAVLTLVKPFATNVRAQGGLHRLFGNLAQPSVRPSQLLYLGFGGLVAVMALQAWDWRLEAKVGPLAVAFFTLGVILVSLFYQVFKNPAFRTAAVGPEAGEIVVEEEHMDNTSDFADLSRPTIFKRAAMFLGWMIGFLVSMATIGLIPTVPLFTILYMRLDGKERWQLVLPHAIGLTAIVYLIFDRLLNLPWPSSALGSLVPALTVIPSV